MSTIHFSAEELANFVACWVESGALQFDLAMQSMDWAIASNARAYAARYNEYINPEDCPTVEEVERLALNLLAKKTYRRYGAGLGYNCAEDTAPGAAEFRAVLAPVEKIARDWSERIERERQRKAENDQAYAEEGPLQKLPPAVIGQKAIDAGFSRVIVAEFRVNESDSMSDYYGSRSVREVVIGFGKGKRESFAQLRTAAGQFPPTQHLGPNCGRFGVWIYNEPKTADNDTPQGSGAGIEFLTKEQAEQWIEQAKTSPTTSEQRKYQRNGGYITEREIEHRENYSMGGGNYLGHYRHNGWQVYSHDAAYFMRNGEPVEFFEPPTVNGKPVAQLPKHQRELKPAVSFPRWTAEGLLQKTAGALDWPHYFRKATTAQADADKLQSMGIPCEVVETYSRVRGSVYLVKRIDQAAEPQPPAEPPAHVAYAHNV